jgi:hypothetical protein
MQLDIAFSASLAQRQQGFGHTGDGSSFSHRSQVRTSSATVTRNRCFLPSDSGATRAKLKSSKGQVPIFVVDDARKTPTEN